MKTKRNTCKRTLASILILTATAIGLSACGGGDSSGGQYSTVTPDSACGIPNYHAELQNYLNAKRASGNVVCGGQKMPVVNQLAWHSALQGTAIVYAAKSAGSGKLTLAGVNQHLASSYSYRYGYPMAVDYQESPQGVVDTLMAGSTDMCQNMMSSLYKEIGASCARSDAGVPFHVVYMAGGG